MIERIDTLEDPRLEPYRDIRNRNWIERSGIFIAEGPLLVESVLHSDYACQSILVDDKHLDRFASLNTAGFPMYVLAHELIERLIGYNFHRGVLACGTRKPPLSIEDILASLSPNDTLAALIGVQDPENVGGILRSCAALGVRAVVMGPGSADYLSRRVLRVSMGNVLFLNVMRSDDFARDLEYFQNAGVLTYATSLAADSLAIERVQREGPALILFGNERRGLSKSLQDACGHRIRIAMAEHTDSLNVSVAAGIFLHHFCKMPFEP